MKSTAFVMSGILFLLAILVHLPGDDGGIQNAVLGGIALLSLIIGLFLPANTSDVQPAQTTDQSRYAKGRSRLYLLIAATVIVLTIVLCVVLMINSLKP